MKSPLISLAAALALLALTSSAAPEPKGIHFCKVAELCLDINRPLPAAPSTAPTDLSLRYRYSGPEGTGKQWALDNGATLHSGDLFTIEIEARKPLYLYLFHFDSNGQLHELLSLSRHANHLAADQVLLLPALHQHFFLDTHTGLETLHSIASPRPLDGLMARYQKAMLGNGQLEQLVQKGIGIADDRSTAAPLTAQALPVAENGGRTIACQGGAARQFD